MKEDKGIIVSIGTGNASFISINGKWTELTEKQIEELGLVEPRKCVFDDLAEAAKRGEARKVAKIGDVIEHEGESYRVIGIGHDCDASGNKDTITFMRETTLEYRPMNAGGACKWETSDLRGWLNEEFIKTMPEEIIRNIRIVVKQTADENGGITFTKERLFVPSETEMFGSAIYSACEDGKRYEDFTNSKKRRRPIDGSDYDWYWLRSSVAGSAAYFCIVGYYGFPLGASAAIPAVAVPLCFCI